MKDSLCKPDSSHFSSGPVKKTIQWDLKNKDCLAKEHLNLLGRSHRSKEFLQMATELLKDFKQLMGIPEDYKIICLTGGATAAMETAMWNLLGPRNIDCLVWDVFGELWHYDIIDQLKLQNVTSHTATSGNYPNLSQVDFKQNDIVITLSGTTSGVIFKDEDKIPQHREGLVIADATSYLLAYDVDWSKLDAVAFSWQKIIAGEASHGMLVLSPRAIERLNSYNPPWPIPRVFRLKDKGNKLLENLLDSGIWVNTPSALAVLDARANINWINQQGGTDFIKQQVDTNYNILKNWVNFTPWVDFLVKDEGYRSKEVACLTIDSPEWHELSSTQQTQLIDYMVAYLADNQVAVDIPMHAASGNLGVRIWLGYNISSQDVERLTKWLTHSYNLAISKVRV